MEESGRNNAYICQKCGQVTLTRTLHRGVTPFMIGCLMPAADGKGKCDGQARSQFYRVPPSMRGRTPAYEWYDPTPEEEERILAKYTPPLRNDWRRHFQMGGLRLRQIGGADVEV